GAAEAEALFLQKVEDDRQRLLIRYLERMVDRRVYEIGRYAVLSDALGDGGALGLQFAILVIVIERGAHRVRQADLHVLVALLERHARAGKRSARADGADEAVHLAVRLCPD